LSPFKQPAQDLVNRGIVMNPITDIDGDGKVDQADIDLQQASDAHDKQETQRYMAICAFTLMVVITIVMCTPVIPDERVKSLSGLISSMYFALASLCGAYMGFTTWAAKK
tara:strand:- start:1630 stop:1959 length:330 start_codon:yes stop_codon:yes gene_type:complete